MTYQELRRRGLCVDCRRPVGSSACRCHDCAETERKRSKNYRIDALAKGICVSCRTAPRTKGGRCEGCWTRQHALPSAGMNVTHARREAQGKCRACGGELRGDISKRCPACLEEDALKAKTRRLERLARGVCACGRKLTKAAPGRRRFSRCWRCRQKRQNARRNEDR